MCNCQTYMDIRGRCDPILDPNTFTTCRARFDTAYFHISNDYAVYKRLEKCKTRIEEHLIIKEVASNYPYNIEEKYFDRLLKCKERDEQGTGSYDCRECGYYVPYDYEGEHPDKFMCINCYTDKHT